MKALIVNDVHLRDTAPSSATESYQDDLFELLHQAALKERELGADIVLFAGDIFDFKLPSRTSHKLMLRSIEAFREFKNAWGLPGNHDMTQDRYKTVRSQQPLGVVFEASAMNELVGWHPDFPIFGIPWQQDWHDGEARMKAFEEWREGRRTLHGNTVDVGMHPDHIGHRSALVVTHAPIYPLGLENEFDHIPTAGPDGISAAMGGAGYLAYGHIHEDHGIFESGGVTYANHGALSRGSLHEYNLERTVAITLWDSTEGFSRVDLPQKPPSEVFRLQEIQEERQAQISLDGFLTEVGSSTLAQSTTESVRDFIQNHPVADAAVKARALSVLDKVT